MRIVHVITSLESGGAERMLSNLVNYDTDNEHIIVTLLKTEQHYSISNRVKIIPIDLSNGIIDKIKSIFILNKIVRQLKPNVIQTWMKSNFFAPIIKFFNKDSLVFLNIRHGVNKKYNCIKSLIEKRYLGYSDGTIFVSNSAYKEFENIGVSFKNYIIIPNGFQKRSYDYNSPDCNLPLTFGYVGRCHRIKNQDLLISGFNKFARGKKVLLLIAGKGMEFKKFKHLIDEENKHKFKWLGEIKDTYELYQEINALILTSRSEGFPNVIGEAMSIGVPVVTTDAGESYKIIGDTGFKIKSNIDSLTETLNYIYTHQEEMKVKSYNAYKRIRDNYSIEVIVNQYKQYYNQKLEAKK